MQLALCRPHVLGGAFLWELSLCTCAPKDFFWSWILVSPVSFVLKKKSFTVRHRLSRNQRQTTSERLGHARQDTLQPLVAVPLPGHTVVNLNQEAVANSCAAAYLYLFFRITQPSLGSAESWTISAHHTYFVLLSSIREHIPRPPTGRNTHDRVQSYLWTPRPCT